MSTPRALVVRAPGTNRDGDVAFALDQAGARSQRALLGQVIENPTLLHESQLLVIPGGFSFADALGAGRLFALELVTRLGDELRAFVAAGKPVLGICNGFQVLVRTGLLPGGDSGASVALGHNQNAAGERVPFVCDWVTLEPLSTRSIWTAPLTEIGDWIECPIAHGEGRFVCSDDTLAALTANDQIAFRYTSPNPNGSVADVAGICDDTGLVLGMMPHPENHVVARQHPQYVRGHRFGLANALFTAGVTHAAAL
ncbi:MAG: phosphoribosylformylglycinamidine synthase I [Ilumatobacteraceae bacterium]